jgi:hypothetical protein
MNIQRILFSGLLMATMAIPCADLIARGRPGGGGGGGRPSGGGGSRPSMSRADRVRRVRVSRGPVPHDHRLARVRQIILDRAHLRDPLLVLRHQVLVLAYRQPVRRILRFDLGLQAHGLLFLRLVPAHARVSLQRDPAQDHRLARVLRVGMTYKIS